MLNYIINLYILKNKMSKPIGSRNSRKNIVSTKQLDGKLVSPLTEEEIKKAQKRLYQQRWSDKKKLKELEKHLKNEKLIVKKEPSNITLISPTWENIFGKPINDYTNKDTKMSEKSDQQKHETLAVQGEIKFGAQNKIESDQELDRDEFGKFVKGNKIKRGYRNPYKKILSEVSKEDFEIIKNKMLELAKAGDLNAIQALCKYLIPRERDLTPPEPLPIEIKTETAKDLSNSMDAIIKCMSEGDISVDAGNIYITSLKAKREFMQVAFMEEEIKQLKNRITAVGK